MRAFLAARNYCRVPFCIPSDVGQPAPRIEHETLETQLARLLAYNEHEREGRLSFLYSVMICAVVGAIAVVGFPAAAPEALAAVSTVPKDQARILREDAVPHIDIYDAPIQIKVIP